MPSRLLVPRLPAVLLYLCACGGDPTPPSGPGSLRVTTMTDGVDLDPDGYQVIIGNGYIEPRVEPIGINGSVTFPGLDPATYTVVMSNVRFTCTVSHSDPPLVDVIAIDDSVGPGRTSEVSVEFTCRPPPAGRLVFVSTRDDNVGEIYTINADGSGLARLTSDAVIDGEPRWSPDGTRIAWRRDRDVWVMNADGSGPVNLTNGAADYNARPSWSPDGTRLAFDRSIGDGPARIYTMRADGTDLQAVTSDTFSNQEPSWSPAGDRIAFSSTRDGDVDIYVIRPDGSDLVRLTNGPRSNISPRWSPDGSRLVFTRVEHQNYDGDLFLMNPDGSGLTQLTHTSGTNPAWSPDGATIVFLKDPGDLMMIQADGTLETDFSQLDGLATDFEPDWTE